MSGIFDVVHDNGLSTSLYASKDKFVLFENSYNAANGAPDVTGIDNGTDKIDVYVNNDLDSTAMLNTLLANLQANPTRYTFVHFHDVDTTGHAWSWGGQQYFDNTFYVDEKIGAIWNMVKVHPLMANNTTIIITADHGGNNYAHADSSLDVNYTIPFYLWGPGIPANADLYGINGQTRLTPEQVAPTMAPRRSPFAMGMRRTARCADWVCRSFPDRRSIPCRRRVATLR